MLHAVRAAADRIGYFAPWVFSFALWLSLATDPLAFAWFPAAWLASMGANKALKLFLKHPRPANALPSAPLRPDWWDAWIHPALRVKWFRPDEESFGMPSGHLQLLFFSLSFWFAYAPQALSNYGAPAAFLALLTLAQRLNYRNHTLFQTAAGAALGAGLGVLSARLLKWFRHRQQKIASPTTA